MKYVSVAEMVAIEKEADAGGHSYAQMMEYAGKGLAEITKNAYRHVDQKTALGLVGSGNNGGDTLVAFCYLQEWGWQTTAYVVRPRAEDDPLVVRFLAAGGVLLNLANDAEFKQLCEALEKHTVVLDGILGTGIRLPLRGSVADVLEFVGANLKVMGNPPSVVAVDCPSGVDCDTGDAAAECLHAEMTVTMAAVKQGLLKFPAFNYVGDLRGVGIGLPDELSAHNAIHREVIDIDWVRQVLPKRSLESHKGTFGTVLVVGGCQNYSGAVVLAGEAAFRSGAGWVTLAVPEPLHAALANAFIEATWLLLPHESGFISANAADDVLASLDKPTAILIGPGLGMQSTTQACLFQLLENGQKLPPAIMDADGLKLLAQIPGWDRKLLPESILTPHPGEMAILTGLSSALVQADRLKVAEKYAKSWGHVVVLKGAFTVIAAPDGRTAIIPVATPALARAGTGDVLAGLISGFRAQGIAAFEAATIGAWIHAQAGLHAADLLGSTNAVLAGDVLAASIDILAEI